MIASVEGIVEAIAADSLVIEVGGLGYRVFAAPAVLATAATGGKLKLHTTTSVPRTSKLFGFRNAEAQVLQPAAHHHRQSRPKVAMAIVGSRPMTGLQLAIMQQDQAVRAGLDPGHRQELAERIIFELEEKVSAAGIAAGTSAAVATASENEVVAALQASATRWARRAGLRGWPSRTRPWCRPRRSRRAALRALLRD
ncbi:MAG: OB-fold domain-containing protein [Chloroflexota bacterium]